MVVKNKKCIDAILAIGIFTFLLCSGFNAVADADSVLGKSSAVKSEETSCGCSNAAPDTGGASGKGAAVKHEETLSLTTAVLETLIRTNTPMTILDARTGAHDDGRRIPGAIQLAPDASAEEIARIVNNKDRLIVVYCKNPQCPNFAVSASHLRTLGYRNVLEYPEGIEGWAKADNKIVMNPKKQP